MPDIDLDLPSGDQREKAIQYVYDRYGQLGAAMTANVISYRGRSAARDVGKALGFDEEVLARLSRLAPMWGYKDEKDTAERQFRDADIDLSKPPVQKFLSLYCAIQDLPRHLGQHSGGMVICQGRLDSIVPLQPATMDKRVIVQWDKEDCADMGIVKVDLLGLGMMAVLEDSLALIQEHHGEAIDLGRLPANDKKVYAALQQADTVGLFQVESRAQMASLPRMRPEKFYDLVVQVAIVRPGPIEGKMAHPYLARRQNKEKVEPLHPCLEKILNRTLGVPLFQEQLLRMAMVAAGFTGGEAEELRRAFGFKRSEQRMKEIEGKLRAGLKKNNITGEAQEKIVKAITSFAMFGFPESHAASFALIAYASAYLRTHYLAAFTCAMLNNQPMGFYQPFTLVKDAQRHGLHFKPVDVTRSQWKCTIEEHEGERWVRLGFNYVKGLNKATALAIVEARERSPFTTVRDIVHRVPLLQKAHLNKLAAIGALNFDLGVEHRRDALWQSELAIRPVPELLEPVAHQMELSPLAPMKSIERIQADFRTTGLSIGRHPMSFHRERMNELGVVTAARLCQIPDGRWVKIAGCVICRQRPGTAKGFVFVSLEDETGIANAIVEPDLFISQKTSLVDSPYLRIDGVLQNQEGVVSVRARAVHALDISSVRVESHDFH
jgi:error-prone DNA polymerase